MLTITPSGDILGATVDGLDLAQPMADEAFAELLAALGENGYLRFPGQALESVELKAFSERFGDIQAGVAKPSKHVDCPGVGILSNIKVDGEFIGFPDAGQDWHTDMTYREVMGFVNVLYCLQIPRRDDKTLGGTEFANMHMAYDTLPEEMKSRLADAVVVHNFEKMWEYMRTVRKSGRAPMTDDQRRQRPPVEHPLFLTHPITGRKVLYANPGYAERIVGMSQQESDDTIAWLIGYQLEERFRHTFTWAVGDVVVWDNFGTLHRGIADYGPDEHRLMRRCQVLGTKIFDPGYRRSVSLPALAA
jgi:alpha-ketoglutarate-dependent taurine dioxygenase